MLLANNILLIVACGAVLLGTLYPLILDTLEMGKISVGPPYFDAVFYPLMAPALFLMGVGPLVRWKSAELPDLITRLRWALVIAVIAALLAPLVAVWRGADGSAFRPMASLGFAFGFWIVACVLVSTIDAMRGADQRFRWSDAPRRARMHPASVWGMHLAHLGVAAFVLGVTAVKTYEVDTELAISRNEVVVVGSYALRFDALDKVAGPNYQSTQATFSVFKVAGQPDADPATLIKADAKPIATLYPEKRTFQASGQTMTEAAIDRSLSRDVYLSMGEPVDGGQWIIRAHIKPFINWIWLGCVMMAFGGFIAIADRRYRRANAARKASVSTGSAARA